MDPETLMQLLSDPAMADQLAQMGIYGDKMGLLGQQAKMGGSFMDAPSAQGREVGRAYVASSPLEHAANAVQRIVGAKMVGDARNAQGALMQGDVGARTGLAGAMAQAMRARRAAANGQDPSGQTEPEFMPTSDFPQEQ